MTIAILSGHYGLPISVGIAGTLALGALVGSILTGPDHADDRAVC